MLVTGATGFIGRALCLHLLALGVKVTALHRSSSSSAELLTLSKAGADVALYTAHSEVREIARSSAPDTVFHLAAHYARDHEASEVESLLEANVSLGTHLLEGLVGSNCTVVNAVSYLQFQMGEAAAYSLYSATKQAFVEISRYYRERRGLDIRHVVLYDNFGPGDTRDKLIAAVINALCARSPISLGPAAQPLNILFIDDLVRGLAAAAAAENPAMMSLRAEENVSVASIVESLERAAGRELDKSFDNSRAVSRHLDDAGSWPLPAGWSPSWNLDAALRATYESSAVCE